MYVAGYVFLRVLWRRRTLIALPSARLPMRRAAVSSLVTQLNPARHIARSVMVMISCISNDMGRAVKCIFKDLF